MVVVGVRELLVVVMVLVVGEGDLVLRSGRPSIS